MIDVAGLRAAIANAIETPPIPIRRTDNEPPDTTTREGAEALARKLDAYAHAQGFPQVQHWVELQRRITPEAPLRGEAMWVVRSNLVRGLPSPSVRGEATAR